MKIGDEVFVHGYIDEIRKDVVIVKNEGGYFGTVKEEIGCLIRCKDCKHYADNQCDMYADETLGYVHSTQADGYCWVAERKEE